MLQKLGSPANFNFTNHATVTFAKPAAPVPVRKVTSESDKAKISFENSSEEAIENIIVKVSDAV